MVHFPRMSAVKLRRTNKKDIRNSVTTGTLVSFCCFWIKVRGVCFTGKAADGLKKE